MSDFFPSSPSPGQTYTASDGTIWTWDGLSWTSSGFGATGAGGISNVKVSSGTTSISANGINFVNSASVTITASSGLTGNANLSFDAIGITGAQGFQGFQGRQGVQGAIGTQGFQGFQGIIGNQGFQGFQGVQGAVGAQGFQGFQGVQGAVGNQGFQGLQGAIGNQGFQGVQGAVGIQGSQGFQGRQGVQGVIGVQGAVGIQGSQGFQGRQGVQGAPGAGSVGGANTNIQFNDTGVFGGSSNFVYDKGNVAVGIGTPTPQGRLEVNGGNLYLNTASDPRVIIQTSGAGGAGFDIRKTDSTWSWRFTGEPDGFKVRDHLNSLDKFYVEDSSTGNVWFNNINNVGISTTIPIAKLHVRGSLGFPNTDTGILVSSNVSSDADATINYYKTSANVDSGLFLTELNHFIATQDSFNTSEVVYQYGFYALGLSQGVYNYGFYSQTPLGANNWNFYGSTSANNYFLGSVGINSDTELNTYKLKVSGKTLLDDDVVINNSGTGNALRITQTGTGNVIVFEDSTNPDANPFVINATGNVGIACTSPTTTLDVVGNTRFTGNVTLSSGDLRTNGNSSWITTKSGVIYSAYSQEYSVAGQETEPRDIFFSSDGTKMFIIGNTGNDVTQYTLSVAWDLTSTVTHNGQFSVATQETSPYGLAFSSDGLYMYVVGLNATVYRYNLTTAWTVTSGVTFAHSYSVSAQDTEPQAISFSSDGTKMFIAGVTGDDIFQYTLSTAWDLSGTVTYNGSYAMTRITAPYGLHFSADGTKMWVSDAVYEDIYEYSLATPWTVTSGVTLVGSFLLHSAGYDLSTRSVAISSLSGIFVKESVDALFVVDYVADKVVKFNTKNTGVLAGAGWHVDGDFQIKRSLHVLHNTMCAGTYYGFAISINGTITCSALQALSSASASFLYTALTTGSIDVGGTSQTGAITVGRSTGAQLVAIGAGVTAASTTKTVNIAAVNSNIGSTTNVNIGTLTSGNVFIVLGSSAATNSQISLVGNTTIGNTTFEDRYVSRAMTRDMGSVYVDKGTQTTGTITFDYTGGSLQRLQVGGSLTIAFSNFPPTANMGIIQIELVNGGSATVTFPTINWVKKDGTFTTSVSTYLTDFGRASLQSSGTDFFIVWTRDAGTTLYGKFL